VRTLVLGVGNPIRGDDGVGPVVAERLCAALGQGAQWLPFSGAGLDLLGWIDGVDRLIVVDAMQDERMAEGECCRIEVPVGLPVDVASHRTSILDAITLAPRLGVRLPRDVRWYGIGVRLVDEYREGLTTKLLSNLGPIVEQILEDLRREEPAPPSTGKEAGKEGA
jgi:hydrogenase maturation protease